MTRNEINEEIQYLHLMRHILDNGQHREDRTGVGTLSIFGHQMRFSLDPHFPLLTTKAVHFKSIVYELLWFIRGDTNIKYLQENGVSIWDEWADESGELGPVYGSQWRNWRDQNGAIHDQLANLVQSLRENPTSRRHLINAWNVGELDRMALPPCHVLSQFYVSNDNRLSCQLYQRSVDVFLGLPFNIASYSLLTVMLAQVCGLKPGEFVFTGGDVHLYTNHLEQARTQLEREPYDFPELKLNPEAKSIEAFTYQDIELINYRSHPRIAAPIAV